SSDKAWDKECQVYTEKCRMTGAQIQACLPPIATLILLGIGLLFNNSRLWDLHSSLNKRIDDLRAHSDVRFRAMDARFDALTTQYSRLESVVVGKFGEFDARLDRIEKRLDLR